MFSNLFNRWAEARGTVLLNEIRDAIMRLNNASPETKEELSRTLTQEYLSLNEQVNSLANVSDRFKKELAAEYRNKAKNCFDRNLGRAYGLAVMSINLEAQATLGSDASVAAALSKEMIEAAREATKLAQADDFAIEQRRILLEIAKKILDTESPLDKMLFATAGLTAAATDLSQKYGERAVEKNCPAMQMLFGFSGEGDRDRAKRLFDSLLGDLEAFKGNESMTWLRMAWMLTPKAIESAMNDVKAS